MKSLKEHINTHRHLPLASQKLPSKISKNSTEEGYQRYLVNILINENI